MVQESSLHQRRRPLTPVELHAIPWLSLLAPAERERAVAGLGGSAADIAEALGEERYEERCEWGCRERCE